MRTRALLVLTCGILAAACGPQSDHSDGREGTSGSGSVYGRGGSGKNNHQRAQEAATDNRPRGGSMQGAGGAGPGYDGSGQGAGEHGTVPTSGSGVGLGSGLTNDHNKAATQTNTTNNGQRR
jgi:hypothetical protein